MVPWGPPSSVVSVTLREPRSGHRKWKIPEIDRSRRKSCTVASSVLESDVIALCPAGRMNHVCRVYSHCVHRLVAWWAAQWLGHLSKHRGACVRVTLFYLIMAPKHMSSDAGSSNMPERSRKVLPFGEKVCVCVCIGKNMVLGYGTSWGSWNVSPKPQGMGTTVDELYVNF